MADWDDGGGDASMEPIRETGVVKGWNPKGFGFITRDSIGDSAFCHIREIPGRAALTPGSKVSFMYEYDEKGGKARDVQIEEAAMEVEEVREMGTVKRWNAEKGFGFIGRPHGGDDAFCHKKDCDGLELTAGQAVSFVFEEGPKGAAAKKVREEEGGAPAEPIIEEDEGERELGKVKSYNEEKGFAFIAPCKGGDDLFSHKNEFGGVDPFPSMPVSYVVEATEKGDSAKKVRQEESVPEPILSDEGREFGKVKNWNSEKGFGFINWKGGEDAIVFEKQCNGLAPLEKDACVSFVKEDGEKGPIAKDIRLEDPVRVARVTAKIRYGRVESYFDPSEKKPTNGYGFIRPFEKVSYGAPEKYYFHMSEIETPDEDGGIEPDTNVSFIVTAARSGKGFQAIAVTIADPPEGKKEETQDANEDAATVSDTNGTTAAESDDPWGSWEVKTENTLATSTADLSVKDSIGETGSAAAADDDWDSWGK